MAHHRSVYRWTAHGFSWDRGVRLVAGEPPMSEHPTPEPTGAPTDVSVIASLGLQGSEIMEELRAEADNDDELCARNGEHDICSYCQDAGLKRAAADALEAAHAEIQRKNKALDRALAEQDRAYKLVSEGSARHTDTRHELEAALRERDRLQIRLTEVNEYAKRRGNNADGWQERAWKAEARAEEAEQKLEEIRPLVGHVDNHRGQQKDHSCRVCIQVLQEVAALLDPVQTEVEG